MARRVQKEIQIPQVTQDQLDALRRKINEKAEADPEWASLASSVGDLVEVASVGAATELALAREVVRGHIRDGQTFVFAIIGLFCLSTLLAISQIGLLQGVFLGVPMGFFLGDICLSRLHSREREDLLALVNRAHMQSPLPDYVPYSTGATTSSIEPTSSSSKRRWKNPRPWIHLIYGFVSIDAARRLQADEADIKKRAQGWHADGQSDLRVKVQVHWQGTFALVGWAYSTIWGRVVGAIAGISPIIVWFVKLWLSQK